MLKCDNIATKTDKTDDKSTKRQKNQQKFKIEYQTNIKNQTKTNMEHNLIGTFSVTTGLNKKQKTKFFVALQKSKQSWFENNIIDPISKFLYAESETKKQSWFENNVIDPTSKFLFGNLKNIFRY